MKKANNKCDIQQHFISVQRQDKKTKEKGLVWWATGLNYLPLAEEYSVRFMIMNSWMLMSWNRMYMIYLWMSAISNDHMYRNQTQGSFYYKTLQSRMRHMKNT